jgi:molybdopterin-guanine dinucleotide biosynthesis protein A
LLKIELLESLVKFTQGGGRKIDAWTGQHRCAVVAFDLPGDNVNAFANANTLAELQQLEAL